MSYLRGDNLSEDPRTDCSERLFISTIMRDTKGGNLGEITSRGALECSSPLEQRVNWVHFPPMKIQSAVYFNFMHMEGSASFSRVAGDSEMAAHERVGWGEDLEKCPFCPRIAGWLNR